MCILDRVDFRSNLLIFILPCVVRQPIEICIASSFNLMLHSGMHVQSNANGE